MKRRRYDHPKPLPRRCLMILARLRAGERLCRSFRQRQSDDATVWWLEPSGTQCGPVSARLIASTPMVRSYDPGLFQGGGDDPQSWIYAP